MVKVKQVFQYLKSLPWNLKLKGTILDFWLEAETRR